MLLLLRIIRAVGTRRKYWTKIIYIHSHHLSFISLPSHRRRPLSCLASLSLSISHIHGPWFLSLLSSCVGTLSYYIACHCPQGTFLVSTSHSCPLLVPRLVLHVPFERFFSPVTTLIPWIILRSLPFPRLLAWSSHGQYFPTLHADTIPFDVFR